MKLNEVRSLVLGAIEKPNFSIIIVIGSLLRKKVKLELEINIIAIIIMNFYNNFNQ